MSNKTLSNKTPSSKTRIRPDQGNGSVWIWIFGFVALAAAAALTIAAAQGWGSNDEDLGVQTGNVETTGADLERYQQPDPALGAMAPTFVGASFDGEMIDTAGDTGIARVIGFFAHWCPHCQAELPRATEILNGGVVPDGVEVLAISTAVDSTADNYPPSDWFSTEAWPGRVVMDDERGSLATAYGLTGFPFWVAVDNDGIVTSRVSGALTTEQLTTLILSVSEQPG